MYERDDWTDFRELTTLSRRAGSPSSELRALVLKELVDNALDAAGRCNVFTNSDGTYEVKNSGDTLPGNPDDLAALFSIRRGRSSSKLIRLPSRGALGNGLRVVAGAVLASGGSLSVTCHRHRHELQLWDDGRTTVAQSVPVDQDGTIIHIKLGESIPFDAQATRLAQRAINVSSHGTYYRGRSSPHWFDDDSFFELCRAGGQRSVREVIADLDGCSGAKAGTIAAAFRNRTAASLDRNETHDVLTAARENASPVKPSRLGVIGPDCITLLPSSYARAEGEFAIEPGRGTLAAEIPFRVEVWAQKVSSGNCRAMCYVNRTPVASTLHAWIDKDGSTNMLRVRGCNLDVWTDAGRAKYSVVLHISVPYAPTTNDGKEPDLYRYKDAICVALGKAVRKARREASTGQAQTQSTAMIIRETIPAAAAKAGGNGSHRFSIRQLFYAVRDMTEKRLSKELNFNYFTKVITDVEAASGPIKGMYRDVRGVLYHPHEGREIPLGTLSVEQYKHPAWTFRSVLYIEKEGLLALLVESKWPERHDCALLSAKGYASRAARDVLDLMADSAEPLAFFAVHDADAYGTRIFEALTEGTAARGRRKATITNLGLEPWEAIDMGLNVENVKSGQSKARHRTYASYVDQQPATEDAPDGWGDWLQSHRVELNSMLSPDFIAWLDRKMAEHRPGKVLPPSPVLHKTLEEGIAEELRERLTEQAILDAGVDERTEDMMKAIMPEVQAMNGQLKRRVAAGLKKTPTASWRQPISEMAADFATKAVDKLGEAEGAN